VSGVLKLGSTTFGTENNGKIDLTNVGPTQFSSSNHTWELKAVDAPIVGANYSTNDDPLSGQLAIYNGATKLWGITEGGLVQNPKLPIFKARKSTAISGTGNVIFDTVIFNQESFYNNTNGRAIAPISGYYFLLTKINHSNRFDFQIRVNDSGGSETGYSYVEIGQFSTSNTGAGWYSSNIATVVYMNAGDYASVYVGFIQQNTDPDMWTHFSGYLIG